MKNDRQTKSDLTEELESVRRKAKRLKILLEKSKLTQQDSTENKRLQEESDVFGEHDQSIFETSQDGLLLVHRSQGDILNANVYAQKLLGYSKEEFSKNKLWAIGVVKDDNDFQEALSRLEKDGVVYYDSVSMKNKAGVVVNTEVILIDKVKFIQCNIRDNTARKQAEERLRRSEEKFRLITENAADLIAVLDLEGKRIYSSPSYNTILGDPELLRGTDSFKEIHPEDREKIRHIFLETVRTGVGQRSEYRFLLEDGSVRYIESMGSVVRDENGKTSKVVVVSRNVTERKLADQELKESKALIEAVIENVPLMIFLKEATDLRFVVFNRAGEELLGYDRKALLGKNNLDLFPPEQAAYFMAKDREVLEGETGMLDIPEEPIMTAKKGQRLLHTRKVCIKGADGVTKYLLGISDDITEAKQAEKQIVLLAHTLKSVAECVSITDLNDNVLFVNNAFSKTYGYTENEILGKNINIVRSPNSSPEAARGILAETLAGGWSGELLNRTKDGRDIPVALSTSFVRDDHGQVIALVGIATDISERKRAEDKLHESEQRYNALFERSLDLVYVCDFEGNFIDANDAALNLLGYKKEEIGSLNFASLLTEDQLPLAFKTTQEIRETGIQKDMVEFKLRCRDGQEIYVESIGSAILSNGISVAIQSIARNITERKQAEEKLSRSEEKYRAIFENVQDVYYETTIDGTILEISPSIEVMSNGGYHRGDLIGKSMVDFYAMTGGRQALLALLMERGSVSDYEVILKNRDGSHVPCSISAKIQFDAHRTPLKVFGSMRDITFRKRAEENVRKLSRAVEQSPASVIITNTKGDIEYVNPKFTQLTGYTSEEVIGKNPRILKSGHTKSKDYSSMWETIQSGREWRGEFYNKKKNGGLFWESASVSPIFDDKGTVTHFLAVKEDITKRKQAEEELQETRDYLDNLLSFANAPIMVWDKSSKITKFNLAFERMTGYTMYDVLGKHPEMLFPDERREELSKLISRTSNGENMISVEMPVRCQDGSVCTVIWNTANIYAADDTSIIATIAHGQDITDRKQVEESLQESELRFRSLYENATIGLYRTTPDGKIVLANPALVKMLGYASFEKLAERNLEQDGFEPSSQREEFLKKIESEGEVAGYDSKWIHQDGTAIFVLESARAIRDSQGKTLYYDGTVENITNRKKLEEQIRQMQKLESLGTLAGGIAHDFNNILGIILAFVTTLRRLKDVPEKFDHAVETISTAVQRGAALVRQILTFARKSDVEFELTNINEVAKEVIDMTLETFPRTLTYSQNLQMDIPDINADRSQIHQALLNLCVNARDAMPDGGVLTINSTVVDGVTLQTQHPEALARPYICIAVSDTGIGMSKEIRERIYEPFFTTKEKGKGTGLGLAVVFGVVQTHKGFIDVESEPGMGTTFRLYLPMPSDLKPAPTEIQEQVMEIPGGSETLLVVEDEETLMMFIQVSLAAKGYTVISAVDGPEAVKTYRERQKEISLVFTDLGLPGMTGMEEVSIIRKINPDAKIIVATGYLDREMKSELLKAGVKKFILKPYDFEEILKTMREVLDKK